MKKERDLTKIAGTLKYGWFSGESRKKIIISFVCLASCLWLEMIALIVFLSIEQVSDPMPVGGFIFTILSIAIGFSAVPVTLLVIVVKNEKTRKEILVWLEDAIELTAYSERIGVWTPLFQSLVKIQVYFEIDGNMHTQISKGKPIGGITHNGYHNLWKKYADRKINIIYSPKYDQVIVLK